MTANVLNKFSQATASGDNVLDLGGTWKIDGVEVTATAAQLNSVSSSLTIANKTGGTLTKGTLVYISGYDTTLGAPTAAKADADTPTTSARFIVTADILNDASGTADGEAIVTGLNTSAYSAVGSLVYLSGTAGESTPTAPTAADDIVQIVGVVKVKDAAVGSIFYFPGYGFIPTSCCC